MDDMARIRSQLASIASGPQSSVMAAVAASVAATKREQVEQQHSPFASKTSVAQAPPVPIWVKSGQHSALSPVKAQASSAASSAARASSTGPIGRLPVDIQEQTIIEELLFAMTGVEGRYLVADKRTTDTTGTQPITYLLDQSLDRSLAELVRKISPICSAYLTVTSILEQFVKFESGLVAHALGAALRELIKKYLVLVSQLEYEFRQGRLTLQRMWFHVQPSVSTMKNLESLCMMINASSARGGVLLNLLHDATISNRGDLPTRSLFSFLTDRAAAPYFSMLESWTFRGIIDDPYGEFMVKQHDDLLKEGLNADYNDTYWENRHTLSSDIPLFLSHSKEKILTTGKYLNVVRECGVVINCPAAKLVYGQDERVYMEAIDAAFTYASQTLLRLLMEDKQLMGRLLSLKSYFFAERGDVLVAFLDISRDELGKRVGEVTVGKLQALLELALRTSTAVSDPFKDELRVELAATGIMMHMKHINEVVGMVGRGEGEMESLQKAQSAAAASASLIGMDVLMWDYTVAWPLSLVISRKALTKYQMIFRHIFYCNQIERELCSAWMHIKQAKRLSPSASRALHRSYILRYRMLSFIQNYQYYMMMQVIEPNWQQLEKKLAAANTLDEVLTFHTDFLDTCLKECMLTDQPLLVLLDNLMTTCRTFCSYIERLPPHSLSADGGRRAEQRNVAPPILSRGFEKEVDKYDKQFGEGLKALMEKLQHYAVQLNDQHVMHLVTRLNFNGTLDV